ncbi:MAG: potassium/proton antiporter [Acidimicrobiales bacterium]|nr:potassium/proton antiporter [Acidimicrobiales bacterium]
MVSDVGTGAVDPAIVMAVAAGLVFIGVLASKVSSRLGIPALLLFIAIGMLAGSEGLGGIEFDDYEIAQSAGVVALAFILFAGGLDTRWSEARPVAGLGVLLATVGVLMTAVIAGSVAALVLDVSWKVGLLLGAIISSTDAAAVFAVLRSRSVGLRGSLRPLLELESGSNDPMAVFLTLAFLEMVVEPSTTLLDVVPMFFLQMTVGGAVGFAVARAAVPVINRLRLEYEGLYPVVLIAVVLLTYGVSSLLGGSGFLAVYVAGIAMGNLSFLHKKSLMRFADGLAWLMQISMFLMLGLLVFPSDVVSVAFRGLLVSAVLILIARPIATLSVLLPGRYGARPSLMVSWVGLRGAVPIILATFPLVEGAPQAELIFNVVFFIVITSVLIQGTTIPLVARWLHVDTPFHERRVAPLEFVGSPDGSTDLHELVVSVHGPAAGRQLVDLGLPQGALVVLISRGADYAVPQGSTVLHPGDNVLLLARQEVLPLAREIVEGPPQT